MRFYDGLRGGVDVRVPAGLALVINRGAMAPVELIRPRAIGGAALATSEYVQPRGDGVAEGSGGAIDDRQRGGPVKLTETFELLKANLTFSLLRAKLLCS